MDNIQWKEFILKDIGFEIFHGKRLTKTDRFKGNLPLVTAGENNQGIAEYIGNDWIKYKNSITVDMFGNCFYHDGFCSGDDNIYFFVNPNLSRETKLFIVTAILKVTKGIYSYTKQFRQGDANSLAVFLPVKENGTPDWDYMVERIKELEEERIKELEEERIKELEAYLIASGLADYELTEDNKKELEVFMNKKDVSRLDIMKLLMSFSKNSSNKSIA